MISDFDNMNSLAYTPSIYMQINKSVYERLWLKQGNFVKNFIGQIQNNSIFIYLNRIK
jgi:hypothetical protein